MMKLAMTVEEIRRNYPSILSLEQVRCILHISKRKAAWLLQNGHIGCTIGEKKTRQYSVATINKRMKNEDGLRFVRSQNGVFTTKEWLIDYFAHYLKEKNAMYRISN